MNTSNANAKQFLKPMLNLSFELLSQYINNTPKKSLKFTEKSKHDVISIMQYHCSSLFVMKCVHTKSSGSVLAVDTAL